MSKELKLDRTSWVKTNLGELAEEISVRVENPSKSQYDRFVGLDCFVSGELKIKKWSETSNVNSSAKAFKAGDVLFARRNAYLKRASLVEFDGCCSGDAFVLRENHDKIVPGFLSFIVNSEKLWTYANSNAEGTMSKRVKWRDLANYEFLLPPKEQQAELAKLLWAMDEVIEKDLVVLERLEMTFNSSLYNYIKRGVSLNKEASKFKFGNYCADWNLMKFSEISLFFGGNAFNSSEFENFGKTQVVRIGNVTENGFDLGKDPVYIDDINKYKKYLIPKGALVTSLTGTNGKRDYGFTVYNDINCDLLLNQRLLCIVPTKDRFNPRFIYYLTKTELYKQQFYLNATGSANQANVSLTDVQGIILPIPILQEQDIIVEKLDKIINTIGELESKLQSSKILQKALINQIF